MRSALAGGFLAAAAVGVMLVGPADAAKVKGVIIYDKAKGYALTIPASWKAIPRTEAQVASTIATLKKSKSTVALAKYYQ